MRQILLVFLFLTATVSSQAQDRVDSRPATLSEKSQEITSALFWEQNKNGKWVSRKNNKKPYLGEGVAVENFNAFFIGTYADVRYLFIDAFGYDWRYPNLEMEWTMWRRMYAFALTEQDYSALRDLRQGETASVLTSSHNNMFMGSNDYSFGFFLCLTETLRSSGNEEKADYAICAKRTVSEGKDVVRFLIAPKCLPDLLGISYFEVSYDEYQKLFTPDKKNTYK